MFSCSSECQRLGLSITNVTWEDTGRSKNSCWGPNICDMTLRVVNENAVNNRYDNGTLCPVIRKPNFADVTADIKIEKFKTVFGNDGTETKETVVPLETFLKNPSRYVSSLSETASLYNARDTHILTSVQYCVLPVSGGAETTTKSVEFNVALYNYNTFSDTDSAVLTIVVSSQGTSVTTVKTRQTTLYFNKNGKACNYSAKRLEDYRAEKGDTNTSTTMSSEEKEKNVLFVFQVPLKVQKPVVTRVYVPSTATPLPEGYVPPSRAVAAAAATLSPNCSGFERQRSRGISSAILSVGKEQGEFDSVKQKLVRDERFPIRCTIQYYMLSDESTISSTMLQQMKENIDRVYSTGDFVGSLVVSDSVSELVNRPTSSVGTVKRPTEPVLGKQYSLKLPSGVTITPNTNQPNTNQPIYATMNMDWL